MTKTELITNLTTAMKDRDISENVIAAIAAIDRRNSNRGVDSTPLLNCVDSIDIRDDVPEQLFIQLCNSEGMTLATVYVDGANAGGWTAQYC